MQLTIGINFSIVAKRRSVVFRACEDFAALQYSYNFDPFYHRVFNQAI
jgi:hypothetical protein